MYTPSYRHQAEIIPVIKGGMNDMKKILMFQICAAVIGYLLCGDGMAHHAMEYIDMESYTTARKGEFNLHIHYDYMVEQKDNPRTDHWEFTPGLSYGLSGRLMADVHTHFAKFGNDLLVQDEQDRFAPTGPSPFLEAVAFSLQLRLTGNSPVDVAVAGVYELPFERSKTLLDGQEVFEGVIIASRDMGEHRNVCMNLTFGKDGDEDIKEWAIGAKLPVSPDPHGVAAGLEILGSFEEIEESYSILPGVYIPVSGENVILKSGLEFGKNLDSMRANVTFMYSF
jgi:hypothetical protein